jgi:uncharacterized protein
VRAVLDPNVLISAVLAPAGKPADVLRAWLDGHFELVVSPLLLAELERALAYPKVRKRIAAEDAERFVDWLSGSAIHGADPNAPPAVRSRDPGDDYLLALAASERAVLVTGDKDLLSLEAAGAIVRPATFLEALS